MPSFRAAFVNDSVLTAEEDQHLTDEELVEKAVQVLRSSGSFREEGQPTQDDYGHPVHTVGRDDIEIGTWRE